MCHSEICPSFVQNWLIYYAITRKKYNCFGSLPKSPLYFLNSFPTDIRVEIDQVWKPDLLLYNSISDSFDSNYPSKAVINNHGKVLWIPPAIVQSACSVDVQFFPFDEQKCDLSYGPWTHDFTRMDVHNTFMIDNRPSGDLTYLVPNGEWNVTSFWATREEVDFGLENPYVFLTYRLHLKRYHKSGIMNYLLPCLTVSILAILVFILPPDAGEKIGLAITTLLTLVVFLQMLGDATPATPDGAPTPVIASFFIYTLCMVTASCVQAGFLRFPKMSQNDQVFAK